MTEQPAYRPIACSLHDQLEAAATMKKMVTLAVRLPSGELSHIQDRIRDIFTREGAEYLKLENSEEIRLDRIESIE